MPHDFKVLHSKLKREQLIEEGGISEVFLCITDDPNSCDAGKAPERHPRPLPRHGAVHTTSHLEPPGLSSKFVAP